MNTTKQKNTTNSAQNMDPKKLENTIDQMYFQGKGVTPEQKAIFTHAVERTGLDPIVGQIRPVIRSTRNGTQMAIQTSIDGYRLIADRTGSYAGSDDPQFDHEPRKDGEFEHPAKATVTVWKIVQGQRCSFTASARWTEYFPQMESQQFMWKKMPYLMLAKCAEALALRKAFPADLSGVYTDDEMQQADKDDDHAMEGHHRDETKSQPSRVQVMEYLTSCKTLERLQAIGERAKAYTWSAEDEEALNECYLKMKQRLSDAEPPAAKEEATPAHGKDKPEPTAEPSRRKEKKSA